MVGSLVGVLVALFSFAVTLAIFAGWYAINAYGICKLMKVRGLDRTYRAWIPVWNDFILGMILEDETEGDQLTFPGTTRWIVALWPFCSIVPLIGSLVVFAGWVYTIILCAKMASKRGTQLSMVISSIFGLSGIGLMIYASKLEESPSEPMKEPSAFQEYDPNPAPVVDFTVEAMDEKSAPAAAPTKVQAEAPVEPVITVVEEVKAEEPKKGPIYAKPEGRKGTIEAKPVNKAGTIEATPKGSVSYEGTFTASNADSGSVEFDVPLEGDTSEYVEFSVIEE